MKNFAIVLGCAVLMASPAMGISEFNKQWRDAYLGEDVDEDFVKTARKTGCNVCHVKGEDKKEVRNEYGMAIMKYLKAEDFPKDYIKENPEEAKKKILEGFKKAGEHKSKDGKKFADKIKNNQLPATDAGLE
jgi:hypothetical protein